MKLLTSVVAALALAIPAAAQAQQKVRINLANAFPNNLTLIGEAPVKLSQKLNRLSGGTLELRSSPGQGTVLLATFPLQPEKEAER